MTGKPDTYSGRRATPDLVTAFAALQSLPLASPDLEAFLSGVARLAADVVPSASCGITVHRDGRPATVASSDERAEQLDEIQYGAGEGPCLQAMDTGTVVDVPDLVADHRWTHYRPHALEHGVRCSVSFPLTVDNMTVGALNLYGRTPHAFDAGARHRAETFALQAAVAITLVIRTLGLIEDGVDLERALSSRTIIDQAIGILMAQRRCTADQAFAVLRAQSQNSNRKLRAVAIDLITETSGEPPGPARGFHRARSYG